MRGLALVVVIAGCGRLGFDPLDVTGGDGGQGDGRIPPDAGLQPRQEIYLKAPNTNALDAFGSAVCLSSDGHTLVVTAPDEDSSSAGIGGNQADNSVINSGAAYVYVDSGTTWVLQAYIKASNPDASDNFGTSCAVSSDGSTLAIGAPGEASAATGINGNQASNTAPVAGAAYVFVRAGATWSQQAYVKASNTMGSDDFGMSVALSGDGNLLAVGATEFDRNGAGAVYVYSRSGSSWSQQKLLVASNPDLDDQFGQVVAFSADGSTLAVGAASEGSSTTGINGTQSDNSLTFAGAAYVFVSSGGTWPQQAYIKPSNTAPSWFFGQALALSSDGNTFVVGAPGEASNATGIGGNQGDRSAPNSGAVYVFVRAGTTWSQQAYVKPSNTAMSSYFGSSIAISATGSDVVIGAYTESGAATGIDGNDHDLTAAGAGAAFALVRAGTTWGQTAYLKATNTGAGDSFGYTVAISGDGLAGVAGAVREDGAGVGLGADPASNTAMDAGAVYLFH